MVAEDTVEAVPVAHMVADNTASVAAEDTVVVHTEPVAHMAADNTLVLDQLQLVVA